MIKVARFDEKKLKRYDIKRGGCPTWIDVCINEPHGTIVFEEWRPEAPMTDTWTFYHNEVHYALSGKAEITYTSPPLHDKEENIIVKEGDVYLIPIGTCWKHKVIGDKPYRHLSVIMPGLPEWSI